MYNVYSLSLDKWPTAHKWYGKLSKNFVQHFRFPSAIVRRFLYIVYCSHGDIHLLCRHCNRHRSIIHLVIVNGCRFMYLFVCCHGNLLSLCQANVAHFFDSIFFFTRSFSVLSCNLMSFFFVMFCSISHFAIASFICKTKMNYVCR